MQQHATEQARRVKITTHDTGMKKSKHKSRINKALRKAPDGSARAG